VPQSKSLSVRVVAARWGVWILIAVLSVATLTLYVDNQRIVSCIQGYATKDQQNTIQRTIVFDQERDAFQAMLIIITNPKNSQEVRKKALNDYIALVNRDDVVRRNNPPLPVPTECS
jgi:disulfide oxidoreductase YuzD